MKVKFGFLIEGLRSFGITNPENDFVSAKIKSWAKKPGDAIEEGEFLAEVETDKVTTDLKSSWSGILLAIEYAENEAWEVGVTKNGDELRERSEDTPFGRILLPELGYVETNMSNAAFQEDEEVNGKHQDEFQKVRAAPAARKLAREQSIDISIITGTGLGGRVMLTDVKQAMEARVKPKEVISEKPQIFEGVVLLTPSREWLTVAHNLEKGSNSVIAAGEPEEYDFSELMRLRANHKEEFQKVFGVPLHVSSPIIFAITRALCVEDFWIFNGYWHIEDKEDRSKDKVALYRDVNMGISVDLGEKVKVDLEKKSISGTRLRIATMRSASEFGIKEFLREHHGLIDKAARDIRENSGKLKETTLSDWTGWTFIFNNVGAARHKRGISLFTPKMSAMVNMGVIGKDGKAILQIFFDHRMIDGVPATRFLDAVYEELTKRVIPEIKRMCVE